MKRRRRNLLAADPRCCYCECPVRYYPLASGETMPDDYATIEHVTSRVSGARPVPGRRLLACKVCNEERGAAEVAALSPEERRRRSHGPKKNPPGGAASLSGDDPGAGVR